MESGNRFLVPIENVCLAIRVEDGMDYLVRGRHKAKTRE